MIWYFQKVISWCRWTDIFCPWLFPATDVDLIYTRPLQVDSSILRTMLLIIFFDHLIMIWLYVGIKLKSFLQYRCRQPFKLVRNLKDSSLKTNEFFDDWKYILWCTDWNSFNSPETISREVRGSLTTLYSENNFQKFILPYDANILEKLRRPAMSNECYGQCVTQSMRKI